MVEASQRHGGNLNLDLADASERLVPPRLKLRRHQPVLRISRVILPECPVGGIACRLKIALGGRRGPGRVG